MKPFKSFLTPQLEQYLTYRIDLGYAQHPQRDRLLAFDRYLRKQKVTWDQLQPPFFLKLRAQISEHPNTVNEILLDTMVYLRLDLNHRRKVQKRFVEFNRAVLMDRPEIEALINIKNKDDVMAWLDSL